MSLSAMLLADVPVVRVVLIFGAFLVLISAWC